jgi:Transposase, Mutator family
MLPRRTCAWTWTSCFGRARGGCWRWRCRPRSRPTSPATPSRSTSAAIDWCAATATPRPARSLPVSARSRSSARGVDDRRVDPATGQRQRFQSMILPRWCRRSPKVAEVLPLLYLHGLSSQDFVPALEELLGSAAGLSASVITRLTTQWQAEREAFQQRDLAGVDYVYCWADGSTSASAWASRVGCAAWSSSGSELTDARSWSRSPTAPGSRPTRGPSCCGTCAAVAWVRRW